MKTYFTFLLLCIAVTCASTQDMSISQFHADLKISKDGLLDVTETIDVNFSSPKHGIFRIIPYVFSNNGEKYETKISNINVEGYKHSTSREAGKVILKIGSKEKKVSGNQTYILRYTAEGPFILSEDFSELYWNITGESWPCSIDKASFNVILPDTTKIRYNNLRIFTGSVGENKKNATIAQNGNIISGETTQRLAQNEGLTIAIKLPKYYIDQSRMLSLIEKKKEEKLESHRRQSQYFYLPLICLGGLLAFWKKLRGNTQSHEVADQAYPPAPFSPAEVGAYYDNIVHERDVVSLIPFWAELGYLTMHKPTGKSLCLEKKKNIDTSRPTYEITFFNQLFNKRSLVYLDDIKHQLKDEFYAVQSSITKKLINEDLYDQQYRYWFKSFRIPLIGALLFLSGIALLIAGYIVAGILFLITGIICFILLASHTPPSENGIAIKDHLRGLYQFLKKSDAKELEIILQKDNLYFEKIFPYAVAFGLDRKFLQYFESINYRSPHWYQQQSGMIFLPGTISGLSSDFSPKEISSAFATPPSSSSSGGGFSGGGVGGGFGGGGGGSW